MRQNDLTQSAALRQDAHAAVRQISGAAWRYDASAVSRLGFNVAAIGFAVLGATSLHARTQPIAGVRLSESQSTAVSSDPYQTGRGLLASGDVTGAIAAFRAALSETPQSVDALNALGVAYDRMGRYDISRSYYDSALAIAPDSPLVLNNLGYSLFLQGKLQAAIPLLQQVVASNDMDARATGQRVLNLIAAQMRTDAARASTAIARAEITAPRARVELAANGEQRLVFAAPAPDPVLTASLGDAAVLVTVAPQWTDHDERALEAREATRTREATRARDAAAAANLAALSAARTEPSPPPVPSLDSLVIPVVAHRLADGFPAELPAREADTRFALRSFSARPAHDADVALFTPVAIMQRPRQENEARQSGSVVLQDSVTPAWLLASQRPLRADLGRAMIAEQSHVDAETAMFDSDDDELNLFAARMRRIAGSAPGRQPMTDVQAVANIEAFLARLRTA